MDVDLYIRYGEYEPYNTIFRSILATNGFRRPPDSSYYIYQKDYFADENQFDCEDIEIELEEVIDMALEIMDEIKTTLDKRKMIIKKHRCL